MEQIVCPVCGRDDELEWVGNILDKGTTRSSSVGMMLNAEDGFSPVFMGGTSQSDFIRRFVPPAKFGMPTILGILGWLFLSIIVWTVFINVAFFQTEFGLLWFFTAYMSLLGGIPLGIVTATIIVVVRFIAGRRKRKFWDYAYNRLWYSVYCERDNVIFSYDYCDRPQEYIRHLFTPSYHTSRAIEYPVGT